MSEYTYSEELLSDLHKDARGYRPREGFWSIWDAASEDKRQEIWDGLLVEMDRSVEEERYAEGRNLEKFRAVLRTVTTSQRVDWRTALRWLMQADNEQDLEHFLWKQGVSWEKNREIQRLYKQPEAA